MATYRNTTQCPHCPKVFRVGAAPQTKRNHVVHCAANPERRVYRCDACDVFLKDLTAVRRHKLSKRHNQKPVQPEPAAEPAQPQEPEEEESEDDQQPQQPQGDSNGVGKRYQIILADPPMQYDGHGASRVGASRQYATMKLEEMRDLDVAAVADDTCALLMWTSGPVLERSLSLVRSWGFRYVTVFLTWIKNGNASKRSLKPVHGVGNYTRPASEFLLLARRGKLMRLKRVGGGANSVSQILLEKRREHSRKPDGQYDVIDRFFDPAKTPNRLELFARTRWPGWDQAHSNEPDKF